MDDDKKVVIEVTEQRSGAWTVSISGHDVVTGGTYITAVRSENLGCCVKDNSAHNAGDAILEFLMFQAKNFGFEFKIKNLKNKREEEYKTRLENFNSGKNKICPKCDREHAPSDLGACNW